MPLKSKSTPELAAAIDLGSNSFHMKIVRFEDGHLHVIDRLREMVRLAEGLNDDRSIRDDVKQRALDCLQRFGQRLAGMPPGSVRAVGTNTLRKANNAEGFLQQAEQALGHPIDIIAGIEEARLIYLGVAHGLAIDNKRRMVVDIGGSSTEIIVGDGESPLHLQSLDMGCVTMTRNFFPDGTITAARINKALLFAQTEFEPHIKPFRKFGWQRAIGASGTIRAIHAVVTQAGWSKDGITLVALKKLVEAMLAAGAVSRIKLEGLSEERTPVFIGGVMILLAAFDALGIEIMQVSDGALREGLIYEMLGRLQHDDVRGRSVQLLARRYQIDAEQSQRVARCAAEALAQVADDWELDPEEDGQWLEWAARLHEIGLTIAYSRYHHHGAYIIEHSDIAGFTQQEQVMLATLVRAQRRKLQVKDFKLLPTRWEVPARRMAVLLRLACILNRSRSPVTVPEFRLMVNAKGLHIDFSKDWLAEHPLTSADLEQEAAYQEAAGFKLSFQ